MSKSATTPMIRVSYKPALFDLIQHIVLGRSKEPMGRILAFGVVAGVADELSCGDGAVKQLPTEPRSYMGFTKSLVLAIAILRKALDPRPALGFGKFLVGLVIPNVRGRKNEINTSTALEPVMVHGTESEGINKLFASLNCAFVSHDHNSSRKRGGLQWL